jgi:hypothetical protein
MCILKSIVFHINQQKQLSNYDKDILHKIRTDHAATPKIPL